MFKCVTLNNMHKYARSENELHQFSCSGRTWSTAIIIFKKKTQASLYLLRLNNDNINPLLKEAFHLSIILDKEGLYSWFTYVKNIVSEIGFYIESTEKCQTIT